MTCRTTVMKCKVNLESECQIVKEGKSLEGDNYDWLIFLWHRGVMQDVAASIMSHIVLGTVYYLECFVEQMFIFLHNGTNDNSSMFCDLLWNLEVAFYYFISRCIKYL